VAKILIVDDDGDLRTLYGLCFLRRGHSIVVASNGAAALECLTVHAPDLLVTDLNMPVMDGISMIKELRKLPNFKFTPILMLTTESTDAKKQEGKSAGATGWLVKPFNPDQLLQVVAKVVH